MEPNTHTQELFSLWLAWATGSGLWALEYKQWIWLSRPSWMCGPPDSARPSCVSPSMPILPSPSLSAALRKAFVSSSVRSLPSSEKPLSTNLRTESQRRVTDAVFAQARLSVAVGLPHLSSSSSMKPLPSTSRTLKTLLTFSAVIAFIPTNSKNFLWSNVSATGAKTESSECSLHYI